MSRVVRVIAIVAVGIAILSAIGGGGTGAFVLGVAATVVYLMARPSKETEDAS